MQTNARTVELRALRGGSAEWFFEEPAGALAIAAFFGEATAAVAAPVARGIVRGGLLDGHNGRQRARLLAAAAASVLLVPAVRASPAGTIAGTGTIAAPVATITGSGTAGAARRGVRIAADYRATLAARDARRAAWPVSAVLLGVPRLPPVVGSGGVAAPLAPLLGVGGPSPAGATGARGVLAPDYAPHHAAARERRDALRSQVVVPTRRAAAVTTGTGTIAAPVAGLTGSGAPIVTGAGTLAAPIATLTGASAALVLGSGVLSAPIASVTGAGVGVVTGAGTIAAPVATVTGAETVPPQLAVDASLTPLLALDARLVGPLSVDAALAPTLRLKPTLDPVIAL